MSMLVDLDIQTLYTAFDHLRDLVSYLIAYPATCQEYLAYLLADVSRLTIENPLFDMFVTSTHAYAFDPSLVIGEVE